MRADRVETALHYDMARGDDDGDMESLHSLAPSIETEIRDNMSTRTIPRSEASHPPSQSMSNVTHQSAAVADLSNVIERNRQIAENELRQQELRHARQLETVRQEAAAELHSRTQALTYQNAQNVERVRQQVIAEAEAQHNRKKEGYQKEVLEQLQINTEGAQRTVQQVQQQAQHETQQEARQYVGSVVDFAEQAHRNKIRKKRTGRGKIKRKDKQNKHQIIIRLIEMSEHHLHPIEEQSPKQKPDLHLLNN